MLKLEEQVVSLEIAKKLKALNVEQKSLFYWFHYNSYAPKYKPKWVVDYYPNSSGYSERVNAFTVAELGEMFAGKIKTKNGGTVLSITKRGARWYITYEAYASCGTQAIDIEGFDDESEANARGKMLIYLLENKLI